MFRRRSGISEQHPRHRAVLDGVSVRRRFTASSFRFWGSATSGRLAQVTVLPQLKVDRLCSVVDRTADFDPNRTSAWRNLGVGPLDAVHVGIQRVAVFLYAAMALLKSPYSSQGMRQMRSSAARCCSASARLP